MLRVRLVLSSHDVSAAQTKHLTRFESLSFVLERVDKQSVRRRTTPSKSCDCTQIRFRHRALTCKKRCGRGRLRFRQAGILEERKRSYRLEFHLSGALSERLPATVQGKVAGRVPSLRTPHRRTEVKKMSVYNALSFTEVVVKTPVLGS